MPLIHSDVNLTNIFSTAYNRVGLPSQARCRPAIPPHFEDRDAVDVTMRRTAESGDLSPRHPSTRAPHRQSRLTHAIREARGNREYLDRKPTRVTNHG